MTKVGISGKFGIKKGNTLGYSQNVAIGVETKVGEAPLSPIDDLIQNCGLLFSATPETDETPSGYNMVVTDSGGTPTGGNFISGSYIKMAGVYPEVVTADTQEILYTAGVPNVIAYDTLANISGQQFFVSEDKQVLMFYDNILLEGSECLLKAMDYQNMSEAYQVQTAEGSGIFENYRVTEGDLFVTKEWVVIE